MIRISPKRRNELLDALRRGTVPRHSLGLLAVGLDRFEPTLESELKSVTDGSSQFKALRGEYGAGKTFFSRWLTEKARGSGFVTAEVQISETQTPLYRLETVYRRIIEQLETSDGVTGALRNVLDAWFYTLEQDVLAEGDLSEDDEEALQPRVDELMDKRLAGVSRVSPLFAIALRGYRRAVAGGEQDLAEGIIAWLAGQPNVAASVKRQAGIKGDIDHFGAMGFLQGLLTVIRDSGQPGLVLVLDEIETIQRMRTDVRDRSLNALRQLIDEVDAGRFPGLYLLITGTRAFYEGPQGVMRLEPLHQRLHVNFSRDGRFDNPRAIQIRLEAFDLPKLKEVGLRVRDIFQAHSKQAERIAARADDAFIADFASAVAGRLGGKVGIAPRIFLKKLVDEVLDKVEQFEDYDPRVHGSLEVTDAELNAIEREAAGADGIDQIELDL